VKSYYATQALIRYYGALPGDVEWGERYVAGAVPLNVRALASAPFPPSDTPIDLGRWRELPHIFLANLSLNYADLGPAYEFTKRYGYLAGHIDHVKCKFFVDIPKIAGMQDLIRKAWAGDETSIGDLERDLSSEMQLSVRAREIEISVSDLWTLIRVLFLQDRGAKKTKVCASSDCPTPYFLESRKGQKYCSHKCAVLINVRRFRDRQELGKSRRKRRTKQ
jgi:hypothetical protein